MNSSLKRISCDGLDSIDCARAALDTLQSLCGQIQHLDSVGGDGMGWLLHFIAMGLEAGMKEQREEVERGNDRLEKQQMMLARMREPIEGRRLERMKKEVRGGKFSQYVAEARAECDEEKAFQAEVDRLLERQGAAA